MKDETTVHPADALATSLDRVSGLLNTLGELYNPRAETFSGGNTFVIHAISTATVLLAEARAALDDLHYSCDLTVLEQPQQRDSVMELPTVDGKISSAGSKPVSSVPSNVRESIASAVMTTVENAPAEHGDKEEIIAQSYMELLRKLTAAEVFASEQQALSVPGTAPDLLPLLRSLREDLEKIHNVA